METEVGRTARIDDVEDSIREVVDSLNALPGVSTFSSCGGHFVIKNVSQCREGYFFVAFDVEPSPVAWRSLARIAYAAISGARLTAWYNGVGAFNPEALCFQLDGTADCDRQALALALREDQ